MTELLMDLDEFLRRLQKERGTMRFTWLIGAGMSHSAGIPVAEDVSKRIIMFDYLSDQPGEMARPWSTNVVSTGDYVDRVSWNEFNSFLSWYESEERLQSPIFKKLSEDSFAELKQRESFSSIESVRDSRCYSLLFADTFLNQSNSHKILTALVSCAKGINLAHMALAGILRDFHKINSNETLGHTVFTTNFDDLLLKAILSLNHTARVFGELKSTDRPVEDPTYPQIVHLHGRHTGYRLANTKEEFMGVDKNLKRGFLDHLRNSHLIVLGYSGWDDVAMEVLREWHNDDMLLRGLYWIPWKNESEILEKTLEFLRKCPAKRTRIIVNKDRSLDADSFMLALCNALRRDGFASYRMGITDQAERQRDFMLEQLRAHPEHDPQYASVIARRAIKSIVAGELSNASELISEAKSRVQSDLPAKIRADVLFHTGVAEIMLNNLDSARDHLSVGMHLWKTDGAANDSRILKLRSQLSLGLAHLMNSALETAEELLHEAKRGARRLGATDILASANHALATLALRMGYVQDALERLLEALALSDLPPLLRAEILRLMGDCYQGLGDVSQARQSYESSKALFHECGDIIAEAVSIKALGDIAVSTAVEDARTSYQNAKSLFGSAGDTFGVATVIHSEGDLFFREGEFSNAAAKYKAAHDSYQRLGRRHSLCNAKADLLLCFRKLPDGSVDSFISDYDAFVAEVKEGAKLTHNTYAWNVLLSMKLIDKDIDGKMPWTKK